MMQDRMRKMLRKPSTNSLQNNLETLQKRLCYDCHLRCSTNLYLAINRSQLLREYQGHKRSQALRTAGTATSGDIGALDLGPVTLWKAAPFIHACIYYIYLFYYIFIYIYELYNIYVQYNYAFIY